MRSKPGKITSCWFLELEISTSRLISSCLILHVFSTGPSASKYPPSLGISHWIIYIHTSFSLIQEEEEEEEIEREKREVQTFSYLAAALAEAPCKNSRWESWPLSFLSFKSSKFAAPPLRYFFTFKSKSSDISSSSVSFTLCSLVAFTLILVLQQTDKQKLQSEEKRGDGF